VRAQPREPGKVSAPDCGQRRPRRLARHRGEAGARQLVFRSALVTTALAVAATVLGIALGPGAGSASRVPVPGSDAARPSAVGALFTLQSGRLGDHFCSASVVDSPSGDLVLTAAHCMTRHPAGSVVFVPGYADGKAPYGVWTVSRVIVDRNWQSGADPDDDFAFLVVKPRGGPDRIQDLTGAEAIGIGEPAGQAVTVTGYPNDLDAPINCDNETVAFSPTQFEFDCDGYTNGTSGGPFLASALGPGGPGTIVGVIGGYEQGGLTPSVSYAARFGQSMAALYQTAMRAAGS
jgi:V8-like Glu-specific endopeptidase